MGSETKQPDTLPDALIEKTLFDLKEHIVQIEALLTYLLICTVVLFLTAQSKYSLLVWSTSIISLAGIGQVMRVRNPASPIRTRLLNIASGAASGAGIGITIDTALGGITLGAAGAIGGIVGGILGALAPVPEKNWLDRGEAFRTLYEYAEKDPRLANPDKINDALDKDIRSFEFNSGVKSYA